MKPGGPLRTAGLGTREPWSHRGTGGGTRVMGYGGVGRSAVPTRGMGPGVTVTVIPHWTTTGPPPDPLLSPYRTLY